MHTRILLAFIGFLLAMLPAISPGQQAPSQKVQPTATKASAVQKSAAESELELLKTLQADLRAHKEALERQADRHFTIFEKTVDRVVWAYAGLGAVLLAALAWMFGSTRRELKTTLEEWMKKDAQKIIDDASQELRDRIDSLRTDVASLLNYRERKITWICPPSTWKIAEGAERNVKADANNSVLAALQASGLNNIQVLNPDTPQAEIIENYITA